MKIITLNANGIRSAAEKGFFEWLKRENPDVVCIQETKAQIEQLQDAKFHPLPFTYYHSAQKKGYSGVAIYSKHEPKYVQHGIGWEDMDVEGRFLEVAFENFSVISLYLPSGSSGEERQAVKESMMARLLPYLEQRAAENIILCGDINIAHTEKDIRNWKGNLKNSGFLPQERAWLSALFAKHYCDGFRVKNQEEHVYSWWSNRGQARAKNVGWRIDYHIISQRLAETVQSAWIYTDERFSDHAPVIMEYQL
ncbi:MAG: exodeoxyribonuclease III [Cardiobacteriaceae bacterium]|nr:exodeoxyribonuclease III [Cardiobacteriaceae bacterium]